MPEQLFDYFKESSHTALQLGNQVVHLHQIALPKTSASQTAIQTLSAAEITRAEKYLSKEDENRYTHAQIFKRRILSHYTNKPAQQLVFGAAVNYGKPYLEEHSDIHFNLAYRGNYAILAIADNELGVDIEKEIVIHHMEVFATNFFSESERNWLFDVNHIHARKTNFFKLWTLKEAFIKAIGKGISYPLQDFSILIKETGIALELPIKYNTEFSFAPIATSEGYAAAVCIINKNT